MLIALLILVGIVALGELVVLGHTPDTRDPAYGLGSLARNEPVNLPRY